MAEISKITIPNPRAGESGQPASFTYDIKDATARSLIAQGIAFHFAQDADTTPFGVTWDDNGTLITGRLVASADTKGFYFVPAVSTSGKDIYAEYVATNNGGWEWEKLGDTEISISVSLVKSTDNVLGENTTFTASPSAVTFNSDGSSDTFVKSYPGSTSKLETTTIRGVGNSGYCYMNAAGSSWTSASDRRDKTDIEPLRDSLDFIKQLKPVTYVMNNRDLYKSTFEYDDGTVVELFDEEGYKNETKKKTRRFVGLVAQDLYQTMNEYYGSDNYMDIVDWSGYDHPEEIETNVDQYTIQYERLVPVLIKAVQELSSQIDELRAEIEQLKNK